MFVFSRPLPDSTVVRYRIGPERSESGFPLRIEVPAGGIEIDGGAMTKPGFLRRKASAQIGAERVEELATAAFSPEKIQTTLTEPADFDAFWDGSQAELGRF